MWFWGRAVNSPIFKCSSCAFFVSCCATNEVVVVVSRVSQQSYIIIFGCLHEGASSVSCVLVFLKGSCYLGEFSVVLFLYSRFLRLTESIRELFEVAARNCCYGDGTHEEGRRKQFGVLVSCHERPEITGTSY